MTAPMSPPRLRRLLDDGLVVSGWSSLTDPLIHEALLRGGFDAVVFDMQHGLHDAASVAAGIGAAARLGRPAVVRVPIEDRAMVSRALDFGASAVIMPMIETAEDAERFVAVAKYPPDGLRSYGPARAVDVHGFGTPADYASAANRETLCFAMIETGAALRNLDAIAAIPALDGFFVGPSDLSIALSATGRRDPASPDCLDAIQRIAAAAKNAGKFAAIYASDVAEARRYRGAGYSMVCVASDIGLLKAAAAEAADAVRA